MRPKRHIFVRSALIAGILFTFAASRSASAQRSSWTLYSATEGLSQQTVQAFFQDEDGYLWLGTRAGLNRFDGERFTTFGVRHGLENDWINAITQDQTGALWVATNNGLANWREDRGFINFGVDDGLPDKAVYSLAISPEGELWAGTAGGLLKDPGGAAEVHLRGISISSLAFVDSRLHVATANGLYVQNGDSFEHFRGEHLANQPIVGLAAARDGTVWVSTGASITAIRDGAEAERVIPPAATNFVNLIALRDGSIWGRTNQGTLLYENGDFRPITTAQGMPILTVLSVFEDREGTLWTGGIGGIAKYTGRAFTNYTQEDGLGSNTVWQMTRDQDGALWVGTTAGLSRLQDDTWTTFTINEGLAGDFVRSVITDTNGTLWVGSIGGLSRGRDGRFEVHPTLAAVGEVYWIDQDTSGHLWITGRVGGLMRSVTPVGSEWPEFESVSVPGQRFTNARVLASDSGVVWVSGDNGLSRWDGLVWQTYTRADGLPADEPYSMIEDIHGNLWFGFHSSRGVACFDGVEFVAFTTEDGLSNDAVYSVGADDEGHVWIGTAAGLDRWDGKHFVAFGTDDGYVGSESNAGAFLNDSDGTLWFGAIGGLSHYNPAFDPSEGDPPGLAIRDLQFSGVPLDPETLSTSYEHRDLRARVDYLSSVNRGQIEGQYRLTANGGGLLGQSESTTDWRWINGSELALGNLSPGQYRLEVRARKYRGAWSPIQSASFRVSAPFWQQLWFIALLLVGAAVLIRAFLALKLRRVRLKNAVLQQHIKQLEEADRAKNEFLSNMSHEIRTPIAGILGFAAILREEVDGTHLEFVDHITTGAERLQRTLDSVLDLAQLSNDRLKIDLTPVDVGAEAAAAVTAMRHSADKKGLLIQCFDESGGAQAYSHGAHLARVLDILIFNAIKFTESGSITVSVAATDASVLIKVIDTGIGIEPSFLPRLFEPFRQASTGASRTHEGNGLGLSITKRVIELMGGSVDVQSTPGEGSTFSVTLRRHVEETEAEDQTPSRLSARSGPRRPRSPRRLHRPARSGSGLGQHFP